MKLSIKLEDSQDLQAYAKRLGLKNHHAASRLIAIGLNRSEALRTYSKSSKGREAQKRYQARALAKARQRMQQEQRLALHKKHK